MKCFINVWLLYICNCMGWFPSKNRSYGIAECHEKDSVERVHYTYKKVK